MSKMRLIEINVTKKKKFNTKSVNYVENGKTSKTNFSNLIPLTVVGVIRSPFSLM